MPCFTSTDKSRTYSSWSTYLHIDLLPPTLQKRCNLKIGCKFRRRMQACNFGSLQSQEKCKYSRQRSCFDILTPIRALAPSNHSYVLPLSRACRDTSWGRIGGRNCTTPGMERLSSGVTKLSHYFIEGGRICLTAVCEAAYSFSLPLVCPRKQRKDGEKGWSNGESLMFQDPSWSVGAFLSSGWSKFSTVYSDAHEDGARPRHNLRMGIFYQSPGP